MPNPFTYRKNPTCKKERQENANWAFFERMGADEDLAKFDRLGIKAPQEVISAAHTWRWVEREYQNEARKPD